MVKIAKPAQDDLKQIHEYIAKDSLYYAHEVIQTILNEIEKVENFPDIGRIVPELQDRNIREIIHGPYRIVYRIKNLIEVLAVIHAKRDFNEVVKNRTS